MGLLDTALDLLKSPTVGALTTALTGNNSNAAQQSAAQTQQIYDKLNKVAEDALTAAQNAALGQKNTTTTQTSTGIMSYIWWIVGGVFFFFMMLLLLLFGGRRK